MNNQQTCIVHGVLLNMFSTGVLLIGESGSGKSDLTLELLSRGHRLIADDAVILSAGSDNVVRGFCPQTLSGMLEVRGIGLVDVKRLYGENAICPSSSVDAVIELVRTRSSRAYIQDRLITELQTFAVFHCLLPKLCLPINDSRPLPTIVETAVNQWFWSPRVL